MLRTFIAVKIPASASLRQLIQEIGGLGSKLRPVSADNLHVTLKFLGETDAALVPKILAAAQSGLAPLAACDVRLTGMGAFPNLDRPSVFWVGIDDGGKLAKMVRALDAALEPLGFPPEQRAFHPHLTVLRVKFRPPPPLFELVTANQSVDFGTAHLGAVEYLQSELHQSGAKYSLLGSVPLKEPECSPQSGT